MFKAIIIQVCLIWKYAPPLSSDFVNKQYLKTAKIFICFFFLVDFKYITLLYRSSWFIWILSTLFTNIAIYYETLISNRVLASGWYKAPVFYMIYSVYYCPTFVKVGPGHIEYDLESSWADKKMVSSICNVKWYTDYQSSKQGENCFLNQHVLYKPWFCYDVLVRGQMPVFWFFSFSHGKPTRQIKTILKPNFLKLANV